MYAEAMQEFTQAISMNPACAGDYYGRGDCYRHMQKFAEAKQEYGRALDLDSRFAGAYWGRGDCSFSQGDISLAIGDFTLAIEADPRYERAYYSRARCFSLQGRHDEALADARQALAIDPHASDTLQLVEQLTGALNSPMATGMGAGDGFSGMVQHSQDNSSSLFGMAHLSSPQGAAGFSPANLPKIETEDAAATGRGRGRGGRGRGRGRGRGKASRGKGRGRGRKGKAQDAQDPALAGAGGMYAAHDPGAAMDDGMSGKREHEDDMDVSKKGRARIEIDEAELDKITDPEQQKKMRRALRNRASATASRQRKKEYLQQLEERMSQLSSQNTLLNISMTEMKIAESKRRKELIAISEENNRLKRDRCQLDAAHSKLEQDRNSLRVSLSSMKVEIVNLTSPTASAAQCKQAEASISGILDTLTAASNAQSAALPPADDGFESAYGGPASWPQMRQQPAQVVLADSQSTVSRLDLETTNSPQFAGTSNKPETAQAATAAMPAWSLEGGNVTKSPSAREAEAAVSLLSASSSGSEKQKL